MTRTDELRCEWCGRRFLSDWVLRTRHRVGGRCRTDAQMRAIGLHLNADGYWTRLDSPARRQLRLFRLRPGRPPKTGPVLRGVTEHARSVAPRSTGQERLPGVVWEAQGARSAA